jgi:hypothetical protein
MPPYSHNARYNRGHRLGYLPVAGRAGRAGYPHYADHFHRASRYPGSRYDGDPRRSRSRDRSPDRRSLYSDGGPRRSSAEFRQNNAAFQANRDSFRDTLPRDTPRGPKALLDAPSGPRGGGYSGEFRGRGRGGRGRGGWRDREREDSRDRGRDRDLDFRRDNYYRDERSRERDRDNFRARRGSPRGRSPPGRDFRDTRDPRDGPLGVDPDRARRGSRDGPLSAGSSSSDLPFAHSSYRGDSSYRGGYGRGRGRGRGGDWESRRGRPFYEDRGDRYGAQFRSRSQETRFRDREDRDRDNRYLDAENRPRDPRDERDIRDREMRTKLERTSHEPPASTKDVSPPPVAPAAPSFGSVPNRTAAAPDVGSTIGKAPPTGPRALKDDRPPPLGIPPLAEARPPPTGPSKPSFVERSPPIPSGPRSQRPGPSSKQWINPNLKNRVPDSPKLGRSMSFAQSRPAGFRQDGAQPDQLGDAHQRPRSSDAKNDIHATKADDTLRDTVQTASGDFPTAETRPKSAGSFVDRDYKRKDSGFTRQLSSDIDEEPGEIITPSKGTMSQTGRSQEMSKRRLALTTPTVRLSLPERREKQTVLNESSESEEEDMGDIIQTQMGEVQRKLERLEAAEIVLPREALVQHALLSLRAISQIARDSESIVDLVGVIPEKVTAAVKPPPQPSLKSDEQPSMGSLPVPKIEEQVVVEGSRPTSSRASTAVYNTLLQHPHPSIEQDADVTMAHAKHTATQERVQEDEDVLMEDASAGQNTELRPPSSHLPGLLVPKEALLPVFDEARIEPQNGNKRESSTPSPPEEEEETDIEDVDLETIEIVRIHGQTPPLESLPVFSEKPWDQDKLFMKSMNVQQPALNAFILQRLEDETWRQFSANDILQKVYGQNYDNYIRFTMSDDPVAVKSREKFTFVPGAPEPVSQKPGLTTEPKSEHTRRSRFATERDMEKVMEESRRLADERRERQAQAEREKYRTDKEAVIPSQYQNAADRERESYHDTAGLVDAEKIVATWEVLPPVDNFSEEEYGIFEKAYLEFPKQWGRVAEPLVHRDFGACIQFYYLKKEREELNLKEKLKKQPKKRKTKGRKGVRSSALMSELGNGDNDNDDGQEAGENGERRRPRRAAAPTFNSEATPATDAESGTPAGTPGRRGAALRADGSEKQKRGRKPAKDKEKMQPKMTGGPMPLAAAPSQPLMTPTSSKGNRSRSTSRVQNSDWMAQPLQENVSHMPQYDVSQAPGQGPPGPPGPPLMMQPYPPPQSLLSPERGIAHSDAMAPPPLRPEPPQPPVQVIDMGHATTPERRSGGQPSSYWSVPEANEFPALLRSFGSDWGAIAAHMRTKTAVMVSASKTRPLSGPMKLTQTGEKLLCT